MIQKFDLLLRKCIPFFDFFLCEHSYIRVKGEILQVFSLEKRACGHYYEINFGLVPLCYGIDDFRLTPYSLSCFDPIRWGMGVECGHGKAAQVNCLNEMIYLLKSNLFPIFDVCQSCHDTLLNLISIEQRIDSNRLKYLSLNGLVNKHKGEPVNYCDNIKYILAICSHDVNFALRCADSMLNNIALARKSNAHIMTEVMSESYEFREQQLRTDILHLQREDFGYFDAYLSSNKNESQKYLSAVLSKKNM